jgi:hypothetical protein
VAGLPLAPQIYLLDLDGCRITESRRSGHLPRMVRRLRSSLAKWGENTGRRLESADWKAFAAGLGPPLSGTNPPNSG